MLFMEAGELIKQANEFLSIYYRGEIAVAANKDRGYIHLDFRIVMKHSVELANNVLDDFEMSLQAFSIAAGEIASPTSPTHFNIRFTNIPSTQCKDIWKLRAKEINQFVVVTGYIRRVSDVQHKINSATFECSSCKEKLLLFMPPQDSKVVYPTFCDSCKSKTRFILKDKNRIDEQKIVVEEDPSQIKSTQKPRSIIIILREDLCRHEIDASLQPSTKVVISGLLKEKPVRKDANDFRKYIMANSVELLDDNIENLKVTDKDIKELTDISQSTTLFEDLAQSIVPNVYGHEVVKVAVLLQLMGGVPLYKDNHLEERGVIHILLIGNPGQGKAQDLNSKILTPKGWKKFKDIKLYDSVIGYDGKPTKIIAVHPITKQKIYQIKTRDGRTTLCSENHLWEVIHKKHTKVLTTASLMKRYTHKEYDKRDCKTRARCDYFVPTTNPIHFPKKNLPIDPYTLGIWLGDGTSRTAGITTPDKEIFDYIPYRVEKKKAKYYYWLYDGFQKQLRKNNLLMNKHIPTDYLFASIKQRVSLLQGLIDSDGHVQSDGKRFNFYTIREELKTGVINLIRSLGGTVTLGNKTTTCNGKKFKSFNLTCRVPAAITPCKIKRKKEVWVGSLKTKSAIIDIKYIKEDYARCITVKNPDGKYITDDYLVTHNSVFLKRAWQFLPGSRFTGGKGTSGVGLVAAVQKDDELGGWTLNAGAVAMSSGAMCCIHENQHIITNEGYKKISQVKTGNKVLSYSPDKSIDFTTVNRVIDNGFKDILVEIETYNGAKIKCTPDHEILTDTGYKPAGSLTNKDFIKMPYFDIDCHISDVNQFEVGFIKGFVVSDVAYNASTFTAAIKNKERTDYVVELIRKHCKDSYITRKIRKPESKFGKFGDVENVYVKGDSFKKLRIESFNCESDKVSKSYILGFLAGIINTDCCISHKQGKYGIKTEVAITLSRRTKTTETIIDYVRDLFWAIGIMCVRRRKRLVISSLRSFNRFVDLFRDKIVLTKKSSKIFNIIPKTKVTSYDSRLDQKFVSKFNDIKFKTNATVKLGLHSRIWSAKANKVVTVDLMDTLEPYWKDITNTVFPGKTKNYLLNKVISVNQSGRSRVYDLTINQNSPNFLVSGAQVHNCIDEVDKISKEDISHLNNAMVDMKVSIDKATVHGTLATETTILAAANPTGRVFDKKDTLWKQFGLPKDFLDRFDLVFPVESSTDKAQQKRVGNLIIGKYLEGDKESEPIYPLKKVMKYIAFAKGRFHPKLNRSVQKYLVDKFITLVKPVDPDEDSPTFSYRLLTNIIRLTLAVCRTRLSETVTIKDAKLAINILTESLKMQEIITPDGFDYERAESIMPKKRRDKVRIIIDTIRRFQKESEDQSAEYGEVAVALKPFKIDEQEFDELLGKMAFNGEVTEPRRGRYRVLE